MRPLFSRRHYEAVAKVLSETWWNNPEHVEPHDIVSALAALFKADNPAFNTQHFIDAVLKNK